MAANNDYEVTRYNSAGGMMLTTCKECGQHAKVTEVEGKSHNAEFTCCGKTFSLFIRKKDLATANKK